MNYFYNGMRHALLVYYFKTTREEDKKKKTICTGCFTKANYIINS